MRFPGLAPIAGLAGILMACGGYDAVTGSSDDPAAQGAGSEEQYRSSFLDPMADSTVFIAKDLHTGTIESCYSPFPQECKTIVRNDTLDDTLKVWPAFFRVDTNLSDTAAPFSISMKHHYGIGRWQILFTNSLEHSSFWITNDAKGEFIVERAITWDMIKLSGYIGGGGGYVEVSAKSARDGSSYDAQLHIDPLRHPLFMTWACSLPENKDSNACD